MDEINFYKKRLIMLLISLILLFAMITFKSYAQENYNDVALSKNSINESSKTKLPTFEFKAYSFEYKLENIPKDISNEHLLGSLIAKKLYLLEKSYTSEEVISPGNPQTKTVIKKPVIFDAVKQIERYLKKSVKKGEISVDVASTDFNKVLDVALNILTADTQKFETRLKALNDNTNRIELFTKRVNLVY